MSVDSPQPLFLRKAIRFAVSGLLVTAIHVVVVVIIVEFIYPAPALANGIAFTVATTTSYLINTLWSFSSQLQPMNLARFLLVSLLGMTLSVTLAGLVEIRQLSYWYGLAAVVCTVPPTTFLLHNFWTYR